MLEWTHKWDILGICFWIQNPWKLTESRLGLQFCSFTAAFSFVENMAIIRSSALILLTKSELPWRNFSIFSNIPQNHSKHSPKVFWKISRNFLEHSPETWISSWKLSKISIDNTSQITGQKWIPLKISSVNVTKSVGNLILNGKFHFLCSGFL